MSIEVDTNGVTHVTAENKAAGMSKDLTIIGDKGRLSKDEITKMQMDAETYRDQDAVTRARVEGQIKLKFMANNMIAFTEKPEYSGAISEQQKNEIIQLAQKALTWLMDNKEENRDKINEQQKLLDNYFHPLMVNLKMGPLNQGYPHVGAFGMRQNSNVNSNVDADVEAP